MKLTIDTLTKTITNKDIGYFELVLYNRETNC